MDIKDLPKYQVLPENIWPILVPFTFSLIKYLEKKQTLFLIKQ